MKRIAHLLLFITLATTSSVLSMQQPLNRNTRQDQTLYSIAFIINTLSEELDNFQEPQLESATHNQDDDPNIQIQEDRDNLLIDDIDYNENEIVYAKKLHTCVVCNRNFTDKSNLNKHKETHNNNRPYKCNFEGCKASFKHKSSLKIHYRIHTGERLYTCTFEGCSKAFTDQSNLYKHVKIHNGIKSHKCDIEGCSAAFLLRSDLKRHLKAHSKERPYSCTVEDCPSVFKRKDNLKRHLREVHGISLHI